METIFENYIANKLVNIIQEKSYSELWFKIQDSSCSIFSSISLNNTKIDNNILRIRPDIVIKNKNTKEIKYLCEGIKPFAYDNGYLYYMDAQNNLGRVLKLKISNIFNNYESIY